jgi:hypothetical protein
MSDKTVAIKIGERYFCGFGKGGSIKTAWSIAGAKLFLSRQIPEVIVNQLKKKNKKFEIVNVIEEPSADLVWMTREEFNRSLMLQEMSVTSLKALMNFATGQSIVSKEDAMNAFSINELTSYNRLNLDYLNWNGLSTACLNEVNLRGEA